MSHPTLEVLQEHEIQIITMNDLRGLYDEDYFNEFPGDWLLKPQEDHFWQLMCTNSLGRKERFTLRFIMSECFDLKIRAELHVEKRDRAGNITNSQTVKIPVSAGTPEELVDRVTTLVLDVQDVLNKMRFNEPWNTPEINTLLRRIIRFRKIIEDDGYAHLVIFNEPMPQIPPDLYEDD